ncbi:response regulator transcription factor [Chryseobacterium tructae]|uniref:response regulator n=1 Tax=Chryseobacterium tructae TaxID=1037380 RepID=UPI0025B58A69|nr:response regulator transcription factor [Chryseobacterium tructae]MDN3694402.1 response regulator transcription factor [Chryseobacterium tructae]
MENEKINIAIVDDHPIVIEGLKMMLNSHPSFNIPETFTSGSEIITFVNSSKVDIILLDITLPDTNGTELCREIKKISPDTSVIMFSNRSERSIIMQSIQTEPVAIFSRTHPLMNWSFVSRELSPEILFFAVKLNRSSVNLLKTICLFPG